ANSQDFALPSEYYPEAQALNPYILQALEPDPQNRFPSVKAMAAELLPFASKRSQGIWQDEFCL
ncbi:MAG: hypothetical protein MK135_09950, partial [Polyangiaceae bacterium]|nr:hypothetical protein [Polyangiaceae bacterium]